MDRWSIHSPFILLRCGDRLETAVAIDFADVKHLPIFRTALRTELKKNLTARQREFKTLEASDTTENISSFAAGLLTGFLPGPLPVVNIPEATPAAVFVFHWWSMTRIFDPTPFGGMPEYHPLGLGAGREDYSSVLLSAYALGVRIADTAFTDAAFDAIVNYIIKEYNEAEQISLSVAHRFWAVSTPGCVARDFFIDLFVHANGVSDFMAPLGHMEFAHEFLFDLALAAIRIKDGMKAIDSAWNLRVCCEYHQHSQTGEECYVAQQAKFRAAMLDEGVKKSVFPPAEEAAEAFQAEECTELSLNAEKRKRVRFSDDVKIFSIDPLENGDEEGDIA